MLRSSLVNVNSRLSYNPAMTETTTNLSKSAATKAAILAAARQHFASDGYQGATIRAIATSAGIDPAMVIRYFGDKRKLFEAASEIDLRLPGPGDVAQYESAGMALVDHFLKRWEEDDVLMVLLRSAVTDTDAASRIQELFARQVLPMIQKLTNEPAKKAVIRASLVASQILGLALCRYVLKLPPILTIDRDELIRKVGANINAYIFDESN